MELISAQTRESKRSAVRSARFLAMFAALSLIFGIGQFHRSSGGVLAPVFSNDLSLSAEQLGLVFGFMFIAQGVSQLPTGILLDRYGMRRILPVMTLAAVAGCLLIATAEVWPQLLLGRALIGLGFAAGMMGAYVMLVRWAPPEALATLSGRFLFVGGIGGLLATTPFAVFIEVLGWRNAFLFLAGATLLAALVAVAVIRDSPPENMGPPPRRRPQSLRESLNGMFEVLRSPRMRPILMIAVFLYSPLQVLIGLWAGPFLQDVHGLGAVERGHILLIMALGMNIGMLMYGPLERRLNRRRAIAIAASLVVAVLFAILAGFAYSSLLLASVVLVLLTLAAPFFVVVLAHAQGLFDPSLAGRVVSAINLLAISGIFIMQNVTGVIIGAVPHAPDQTGSVLAYRLVFGLMAVIFVVVAAVYSRTEEVVYDQPRQTPA